MRLCLAALLFVFEPFSKQPSAVGMGLVVRGGLAFNLVPFCEPGRPARDLVRAAIIVVVVFFVILGLALLAAACSSGNSTATTSPSTAASASSLHFYFVTHGDNGTFWSVVQKGEKQAASDLGVQVNYQGSKNDDNQACQFISAAVTDILDGMIARRLNQKSRLGAIFDPAADKGLMVCGYLYYTFAENLPRVAVPGWLTFVVFIRDVLIASFAYLLYTRVHVKRFPPSWAGKTSTVLQAVTMGFVLGVNSFMPQLVWVAEWLFRVTLFTTLFSGWGYLRRADRMLLESAPA